MSGDNPDAPAQIAAGFTDLIEGLRADVREDIRDLREDVRNVEGRLTTRLEALSVDHAKLHDEESIERRKIHGEFYDFIRASELAQARRDGVLGLIRFVFELTAKHSGRLVGFALAIAALIGIATGNVQIGVGG